MALPCLSAVMNTTRMDIFTAKTADALPYFLLQIIGKLEKRIVQIILIPVFSGIGNKGVVMRIKPDLSYTIVQIDVPGMEENMNFSMRLGRSKERSLTLNLEDAEYILSFACGVETGKEDCQVPKTDTDEESGIVSGALSLIPDF